MAGLVSRPLGGLRPEEGTKLLSQGSGFVLTRLGCFPDDHWLQGARVSFKMKALINDQEPPALWCWAPTPVQGLRTLGPVKRHRPAETKMVKLVYKVQTGSGEAHPLPLWVGGHDLESERLQFVLPLMLPR